MLPVFCMNYFIQKEMVTTGGLALTKYQFNVLSMLPHVAAALASLIVGSAIVVTSILMQSMPPMDATFVRYFIAFICILPFLFKDRAKIKKLKRADIIPICLLGFMFFFTFPLTLNNALGLTTASHGSLLVALLPGLSLILGFFLSVEKLNIFKILGCFSAVLGVLIGVFPDLLLTNFSAKIISGDFLMFLAMVQGAAFSVLSKRYFQRYGAWFVTVVCIAVAFAFPAPFILLNIGVDWVFDLTKTQIFYLAFLGTFGGPLQFGLFGFSLTRLGPSRASMYLVLAPLSGSALAILILGEILSGLFILGLLFVCLAIFLVNFRGD